MERLEIAALRKLVHCKSLWIPETLSDVFQIYKDCRNLIMGKYRESPKQRLEFAAVKEAVAESNTSTDLEGLRRIYDFLDAWGLINYEATDGASLSLDSLPPAVAASGVSHHLEVTNVHLTAAIKLKGGWGSPPDVHDTKLEEVQLMPW